MSQFTKKDIVLLFQLFFVLVLMLMPYSVTEKTMLMSGNEVVTIVKKYAYFSEHSLVYGGFIPFISWIACVTAVMLFVPILFGRKKENKINICFLFAIFISLAASAVTFFIFKTLLSGIITVILLASCVLLVSCRRTDLLKYGTNKLRLKKKHESL